MEKGWGRLQLEMENKLYFFFFRNSLCIRITNSGVVSHLKDGSDRPVVVNKNNIVQQRNRAKRRAWIKDLQLVT